MAARFRQMKIVERGRYYWVPEKFTNITSAHPLIDFHITGTSVSFQFTNEEFFVRSRTIPQDSGIGQPQGCPQGGVARRPRVKSRDCAEAYEGTPHKRSCRLTPRLRNRAISGWKLARFSLVLAAPLLLDLCSSQQVASFDPSGIPHEAAARGCSASILKIDSTLIAYLKEEAIGRMEEMRQILA